MTQHNRLNTVPAVDAYSGGPLVYTINFLEPGAHLADIMLELPSDGRTAIELMMPIWSPGFYRIEAYAEQVQSLAAHTAQGTALAVERPAPNRWRIHVRHRINDLCYVPPLVQWRHCHNELDRC